MKKNEFRNIISFSELSKQQPTLRFFKEFYYVQGYNKETIWIANEKYKVLIPPMTIRLTETIYDPFYNYFFKKPEEAEIQVPQQLKRPVSNRRESSYNIKNKQNLKNIDIPRYFGIIKAGDCLLYTSPSPRDQA
eukprot:TRINITY_DN15188_c0_g1_i5.p3 TRINITY_DN15188_c0_g1~~TRINITY_DN15188_c0_g1_i5.p3  ORF type:complete len:134 (+),score=26.36 TRINITY_DN15188_c0_g1_i5:556-957(+)